MNNRVVSVIVPARNEQRLIGTTLERILASARDFNQDAVEIIVIDNASSDRTWETVQQFAARDGVIVIRHDELGAARARNHGRRMAVGCCH